jgi:hypothetical protein
MDVDARDLVDFLTAYAAAANERASNRCLSTI